VLVCQYQAQGVQVSFFSCLSCVTLLISVHEFSKVGMEAKKKSSDLQLLE
jgi:hypothetical protein